MKELVFLLEEPSAREMLEGILPQIIDLSVVHVRYVVFEGKSDLENQVEGKLRGYRNPDARFLIMRDQDAAPNCRTIKDRLTVKCINAGKRNAIVRIACRELETFYLADMAAVAAGLGLPNLASLQNRNPYRSPDNLCTSPAAILDKITNGNYQKVAGSRAIGPHLNIGNVRSSSFKNLIIGIRRLVADCECTIKISADNE